MSRGTYFTIHTHTQAGESPTASILEKDFPPAGTADISLFGYKSFVVMLSTNSNWTTESQKTVLGPHAYRNYAEPVHSPMCRFSEGREKGKSRKVRKWEQQAANRQSLGKESQHLKTSPLKANNTSSRSYVHVGSWVCCAISAESMFSIATLASDEKPTRHDRMSGERQTLCKSLTPCW